MKYAAYRCNLRTTQALKWDTAIETKYSSFISLKKCYAHCHGSVLTIKDHRCDPYMRNMRELTLTYINICENRSVVVLTFTVGAGQSSTVRKRGVFLIGRLPWSLRLWCLIVVDLRVLTPSWTPSIDVHVAVAELIRAFCFCQIKTEGKTVSKKHHRHDSLQKPSEPPT